MFKKILPWILFGLGGLVTAIGEGVMTSQAKDDVLDEIKEDYILVPKPKEN